MVFEREGTGRYTDKYMNNKQVARSRYKHENRQTNEPKKKGRHIQPNRQTEIQKGGTVRLGKPRNRETHAKRSTNRQNDISKGETEWANRKTGRLSQKHPQTDRQTETSKVETERLGKRKNRKTFTQKNPQTD